MLSLKKRNAIPRYCLGELLLEAGVISPLILNNSVFMAQRTNTKLGRILVMSGHLSELDVECALKAQKSVRDGFLNMKMATELLQYGHEHQIGLDEAYLANDSVKRKYGFVSKLGKLLLAANVVDEVGLTTAMRYSQRTSYPLGQALVHLGHINESVLTDCFNLQILVRDGYLYFLDAVKLLSYIQKDGRSLEYLLRLLGLKDNCMSAQAPKVGELLVSASALSQEDSLIVAELGIEENVQFGELLTRYDLVSQNVLDAAIKLQQTFYEDPLFTKAQASRLLSLVHSSGQDLDAVKNDLAALDQPRRFKFVCK